MWFKMDTDLITRSKPFMRCLMTRGQGDSRQETRAVTLIHILAESANETSWRDAGEMSRMLHRPKKSCEQVWQICIEEGVLRPCEGGYNAREWMIEKGLLGDTRSEEQKRAPSNRQPKQELAKNDFMSLNFSN